MTILLKVFAWLLAAAVAFATLGPPELRPHFDLGQEGEHALAFVLIGLAFGLAYPQRRLLTAMIAVALIGLIEILQFWAPGRHARLSDFIVDALAACAGLAFAAGIGWVIGRSRRASCRNDQIPAGTSPPRGSIDVLLDPLVDDLDDLARARLNDHPAVIDHGVAIFGVARNRPQFHA